MASKYHKPGTDTNDYKLEGSYDGFEYMLRVSPEIELQGRGVTVGKPVTEDDVQPGEQHKVGWNTYYLTRKAFAKVEQQHEVLLWPSMD